MPRNANSYTHHARFPSLRLVGYHKVPACIIQRSSTVFRLLVGVRNLVILPQVYFSPLLRDLMLHKYLLYIVRHELPYEAWIPQLTCNAQVFTTSPQSRRLAAFYCSRNSFRREVVLFTSGNRNEPEEPQLACNQFQERDLGTTYLPSATKAYSLVTDLAVTIVSPLGAKPQPPGPKA